MPVVIVLGVPLVLIAAWFAAYGMQHGWRLTLGKVLIDFADRLDRVSVGIFHKSVRLFGPLAAALRDVVSAVDYALGLAVRLTEEPVVWVLNQVSRVIENVGDELGSLAEDVYMRFAKIERLVVPALIAAAAFPAKVALDFLQAKVRYMTDVALPAVGHAIDVTRGRVGQLERDIKSIPGRIGKVEKATIGAGAMALVGIAAARLGLSWIRCRNVTKAGRGVCRMDTSILDTLLADALTIAVPISLVTLAETLLEIEDPLVEVLTAGFSELKQFSKA